MDGTTFYYRYIERSEVWRAVYTNTNGDKLELLIDLVGIYWLVTPKEITEKGYLRELLLKAVARMKVNFKSKSVLNGVWEIRLPLEKEVQLEITGTGDKVETYEARVGLQGKFADSQRWSKLEIAIPDKESIEYLDVDISGTYELLDRCGTALGALHKRVSSKSSEAPVYLFFDPTRNGRVQEDSFVFATNNRALAYGEDRGSIAYLAPSWRPPLASSKSPATSTKCNTLGKWTPLGISMKVVSYKGAKLSFPKEMSPIGVDHKACKTSTVVLRCEIPLKMAESNISIWGNETWKKIDLTKSSAIFRELAWLTQRFQIPPVLSSWKTVETPVDDVERCEECAPVPPAVKLISGVRSFREDPKEASVYEQMLKQRPDPLVIKLRKDGDVRKICISVNPATLLQRAYATLPPNPYVSAALRFSWRIVEHTMFSETLTPFTMLSNRHDAAHEQPPHFKKYPLRPEQQRSLGWMIRQEATDLPFEEEEVTETVLPNLGWRLEAQVIRPVLVRGGIIADQVGYGKTAITLGLIDAAPVPPHKNLFGHIPLKATLIVVPPHLMRQWPNEISRFTGDHFNVVQITTLMQLKKLTIKNLQKADIVVVASSLFYSPIYLSYFSHLSGGKELPAAFGRIFTSIYSQNLTKLRERVDELQKGEKGYPAQLHAEIMKDMDRNAADKDAVARAVQDAAAQAKARAQEIISDALLYIKAKAPRGIPTKKKKDSDDEDDEDDEEGKPKKSAKQEKTTICKGEDPWSLTSRDVARDWTAMTCPPLEMFEWGRIVVDEFTYIKDQEHCVITNLHGNARWCLSGTTPIERFYDVKGVASFLGIHLGVNEAPPSAREGKQMTTWERMQFFKELYTNAWHARRHRKAQEFLNRFVRQNIAEIDEIKSEEHVEYITLTPPERAIYLELDHYLQSIEIPRGKAAKRNNRAAVLAKKDKEKAEKKKGAKGKGKGKKDEDEEEEDEDDDNNNNNNNKNKAWTKGKGQSHGTRNKNKQDKGDREEHITESFVSSATMEEALLKCCSHYDMEGSGESAEKACEAIVARRTKQLEACKKELEEMMRSAQAMFVEICAKDSSYKSQPGERYQTWVQGLDRKGREGCGDDEAAVTIKEIANKTLSVKTRDSNLKELTAEALIGMLREHLHRMRTQVKELVNRFRSVRFFRVVRDAQVVGLKVDCPVCKKKQLKLEQQAVLSCCGHVACKNCLYQLAEKQACPAQDCSAPARITNVMEITSLGTDKDYKDNVGSFGTKLRTVVEIIKKHTKKNEYVTVFVQFEDLMVKVHEALAAAGIEAETLRGSSFQRTKTLSKFQDEGEKCPKVLLLLINDKSSSGANLTKINHAILLHSLYTETHQEFQASETQAIGRIKRYGQQNLVHIWRMLAKDTMDTKIYDERVKNKL
eukprot:Phypoly_transcript_00577.p1 GENE.Phypoly_transcript_00577~~Phypoly_transcript_00577.p1  ORF type:complete len:1459 (+),score=393.26 Phypoly_transcript_00577:191-4378(+)